MASGGMQASKAITEHGSSIPVLNNTTAQTLQISQGTDQIQSLSGLEQVTSTYTPISLAELYQIPVGLSALYKLRSMDHN